MTKKMINALSALLLLALIFGCKKDDKKTPATLSSLFKALEEPIESGSFASNGGFTSQSGHTSLLSLGFISPSGQQVNSDLALNLREITTRGDMIRYQTATQTVDGVGLQSFGQLYISVTESGKPVNIAAGKLLQIDMKVLDGYAPGTDVFYGNLESGTGRVTWNDDGTPDVFDVNNYEVGGESYLNFGVSKLYWINAATPLDVTSGPTTNVCATLPTGFTTDNTAVFMVLTNAKSVFSLGAGLCSPEVLVGYEAIMVALAVQGNEGEEQYFMAHSAPFAITADLKVAVTPTEATVADINNYLNGL